MVQQPPDQQGQGKSVPGNGPSDQRQPGYPPTGYAWQQYGRPGYGPPGYPPPGYFYPKGPRRGLAVASLTVGACAAGVALIPFVGWGWGPMAGIVAIVLGIVALVQRQPKGMGVAGISLGAGSILIAVVAVLLFIQLVAGPSGNSHRHGEVSGEVAKVRVTASGGPVTVEIWGTGAIDQDTGRAPKASRVVRTGSYTASIWVPEKSGDLHVSVHAAEASDASDMTCRIAASSASPSEDEGGPSTGAYCDVDLTDDYSY